MKVYNFVRSETFKSKKGEEFFKVEFCDKDGVHTFITNEKEHPARVLVGLPYLGEFKADCYFFFNNGSQRSLIFNVEVK